MGKRRENLETKYPYVCHAEMNAILNYRGSKKDLENAKIYVDLFPCNECAKIIIQSGIKHIIYLSDKYADSENNIASRRLFDECGVKYEKIKLEESKEIVIDLKNSHGIVSLLILKNNDIKNVLRKGCKNGIFTKTRI